MYGPLRFSRTDLVALTIQRGRDFGLGSYTEVRKALALPPVETFEHLNPELSSSNPKVKKSPNQSRRQGNRLTQVVLWRPNSCCAPLQNFIMETCQSWSSSLVAFWSLSAALVRCSQPSSWTSLSASGTGTVSGSRTDRTGTLVLHRRSRVQQSQQKLASL